MTAATSDMLTDRWPAYWDALASGDARRAVAVALEARDAGAGVPVVLDRLVAAGQAEVGRLWAADDWTVAQEHRATSVSEDVVAALSVDAPTAPANGRSIVVTCADGEWHSLPSRILAATLRHSGWQVTYLGASVPTRHLVQLLHDIGPDAVALSLALPVRLWHARHVIEESRAAGVPVIVGGRGFGPDGRWGFALGASAWAPDARTAAESIELPAFVDPAPPVAVLDDAPEQLRRHRGAVVDDCIARLKWARLPDVEAYDEYQWARTEEDFGYIVDFLAAALYVGDPQLFTDFVEWLDGLLVARGVPSRTLRAGLDLVDVVVALWLPDAARAHAVLAEGRARAGVS